MCARLVVAARAPRPRHPTGHAADPPDLVVDGKYAVEVTRLNQRIVVGDEEDFKGRRGSARKPLMDSIAKALDQLGPPGNEGRSWIVDFEYDFF